jgi:hypothetical protein
VKMSAVELGQFLLLHNLYLFVFSGLSISSPPQVPKPITSSGFRHGGRAGVEKS